MKTTPFSTYLYNSLQLLLNLLKMLLEDTKRTLVLFVNLVFMSLEVERYVMQILNKYTFFALCS